MIARLCFTSAVLMVTIALVGADQTEKKDAEKKKDPLKGILCVVSNKPINPEATAEYKKGAVYFCCTNCPKAFKADTKKFATKANHQLFATKQVKQAKCPLSGRALNEDKKVRAKVAGVAVRFCCENCQGAVVKAEKKKKVELVFSEKAFEKGFVFPKPKEGDTGDSAEEES